MRDDGTVDDLLVRFRNGDEDAVRTVYRRHAGAIDTVARSIVRDPELAAEVVQTTFMKAWKAAASFDDDRDLAPWLYSIARRTAIDVLRHERRPTIGDHEAEVDVAVVAMSFERTWEIHEVRLALDALAPDERETMRLAHLEQLTHSEIAERLGVPLGTVKSRLSRAGRRLAEALGHLDPAANRTRTAAVESGEE